LIGFAEKCIAERRGPSPIPAVARSDFSGLASLCEIAVYSKVLKRREPLIQLPCIEYAEAKRVIDALVEEVSRRGKAGVVAVADPHGELIAFARMDGAPYSSILIAMNKAYTAARERKATKEIGEAARHPEKGFDIAYFGEPRFVGWGGGVPVWKDGKIIGSVAVSGLPQTEDMELAKRGADMISKGS
jgi:glc operon protein GlcG